MIPLRKLGKKAAALKLCEGIFGTSNLVSADFDDVSAFRVVGRNFPQQPDGAGVHICFSISWHALGKSGRDLQNALEALLPDSQ